MLAPAKTPPHLIKHLHEHVAKIMAQPEVKERLAAGGSEAVTSTPGELMAKFKADDVRMRRLFKQIGLSPSK